VYCFVHYFFKLFQLKIYLKEKGNLMEEEEINLTEELDKKVKISKKTH
jgi:hypothetical protein